MVVAQVMVEVLKYLHKIQKCKYMLLLAPLQQAVLSRVILKYYLYFTAINCFILSADDILKSMDCENNLIMFKAIAHLQVNFLYLSLVISCATFFNF